ncbi:MATE family efflux transporter [Oleiharenicola lentus]|uniref:MATE family efflux transporter n=1 Tax=Oleiharenicola lentus TaxID=2508720 RepID=UPI003F676591
MSSPRSTLSELRATLSLALPIIVGQVSQMLIGVTDNAFIGRVGTVELAAAAFTHGAFHILYVVGIGLLLGTGVFAARDHGAGDEASCAAWLRHGRALALIVGGATFGLILILSTQLHRYGQPPEVIAVVKPFLLLIGVSFIPALFFQVQRQFAESLGRPWVPMGIMIADIALNALLNWIFVFGHLGVPPMGLVGSGVATLIARIVAVVALGWWLKTSPTFAVVRDAPWRGWEWRRFVELLKLGVPAGSMFLFEGGAFAMAALMMGWLGTVPLAAHQVALGCAALTFMVPLGMSMAVSLRVSKAIGEGRREAARSIGFGAFYAGLGAMIFFACVFAFAGRFITGFFTPAVEVASLAAQLLFVAAIFQVFDGAQVISAGALRGLTDVRVPTVLTFIAYWVVSLPLGYVLAFKTSIGAPGLWIGLATGLGCAAVLLGWRFHRLTRVA